MIEGFTVPRAVLPNEGLSQQLADIVKTPISGRLPWQLLLWINDIVPTQTTVLADLHSASFSGYSEVTLTRSVWTDPVIDTNRAVSYWGTLPITWISSGGPTQTIYGYAMYDAALGVIRSVQRFFPADIRTVSPGGAFSLLPAYSLGSDDDPVYYDVPVGGIAWSGSAIDVWTP